MEGPKHNHSFSIILTNIWREPLLRSILLVILFVSLALPSFSIFYLVPEFSSQLVAHIEDEAKRTAEYMTENIFPGGDLVIPTGQMEQIHQKIETARRTMLLDKVKVFTDAGNTIYSTDKQNVGEINNKDYFNAIVRQGKIYSKMARKDSPVSEGRITSKDVAEVYVPVKSERGFSGAFEIYYDITAQNTDLKRLNAVSSTLSITVSVMLLLLVLLALYRASRASVQRRMAEDELLRVNNSLEERVLEQTYDLQQANAKLSSEIVERLQAESSLRESNELNASLIRTIPFPMSIIDTEGKILFSSILTEQIFGRKIVGERCWELYKDDQQQCLDCPLNEKIQIGRTSRLESNGVMGGMTYEVFHTGMLYQGKEALLELFLDVTERKQAESERVKLENQLLQSQKIESIGQLAGGVAHDFNNMLGVILGHAELGLMKADPTSPFLSDLQEIIDAAQRSADLTRQLLTFARKQVIAPKVLDLNDAVGGTLKMLQRLIGENIQLSWNPAANLWPVKVDPSQLDQILANLCVNARDAITDTGKISIKTENRTLDESSISTLPYDVVPGDYVLLSVSDDGCGMDKETQSHIFEPFYTTKEAGSGTGLGLATVYGAVKQNHGFFTLYSEPGLGTVFNIYLPRTNKVVEAKQETAEKPLLRGTETVLLVEDDEMLLRLITTMLEESGYTVLAAITTDLAQTLAKEHPGPIHLLISDMIMPVMNGRELSAKLQPLRPEMKVLFLSGYTADIISSQGVIEDAIHFLQKPFSFESLTAKVREVLDGHGA